MANKGQTDFVKSFICLPIGAKGKHLANVTENLVIRHSLLLLKGSKLFLPCSSRLKTIQIEDFQDVIERIHSDLESQAQSCFLESYRSSLKNTWKQLFNEEIFFYHKYREMLCRARNTCSLDREGGGGSKLIGKTQGWSVIVTLINDWGNSLPAWASA